MKPSERPRSTPNAKLYTNSKISNRTIATPKRSKYDNPKISNREQAESKAKEYTDPKISNRSSSVFKAKEYNDNIGHRGLVINNKKDSVQEFLSNTIPKPNPRPEYKGPATSKPAEYFRDPPSDNVDDNFIGPLYEGKISDRRAVTPKSSEYFRDPPKDVTDDKKDNFIGPLYQGKISDRRISESKSSIYFRDPPKDTNGDKKEDFIGPEYEGKISDRRIAEPRLPKYFKDNNKIKDIEENYVTVGKNPNNPNYNYIQTELGEDSEGKFINHISDRRPYASKPNPTVEKYANTKFDNSELYNSMSPEYGYTGDITDNMNLGELMNSNNLYSRDQINSQKYTAFNRFGVIDPYNGLQNSREYLFFTKPNLHIMNSKLFDKTNLDEDGNQIPSSELAEGIRDSSFFVDLYDRYPEIIYQLESGCNTVIEGYPNLPFMNLLSNMVSNTLDVPGITAREIETATNMYGTSISYRGSGYKSDEDIDISLEFTDSKYGELYMLLKAYEEYSRLKDDGMVYPPEVPWDERALQKDESRGIIPFTRSHKFKELHDRFSIYKFIVDEDGETILFWAKYIGCYFKSVPRDAYSDLRDANGLKYTVDIKCPFVRDMDPIDLVGFNSLIDRYKTDKGEPLDIWRPQSPEEGIFRGKMDGRWATLPYITSQSQADMIKNETYKWLAPKYMRYIYKLRWYL